MYKHIKVLNSLLKTWLISLVLRPVYFVYPDTVPTLFLVHFSWLISWKQCVVNLFTAPWTWNF